MNEQWCVCKTGSICGWHALHPQVPAPQPSQPVAIPRFGFWHNKTFDGQPGDFEEMPDGPYIRYEDHLKIVARLEGKGAAK